MTLVVISVALAFGARKFTEMYTMSNPQINSFPLKINLTDPKQRFNYHPASSNF
jgi:hypothetical protein